MNESQDPIDVLADAFLEVVKCEQTKQEYNRVLFCKIDDIKQFKICRYKFENNTVFETNYKGAETGDLSFQVPVIYVSFCGTILKSGISEGGYWYEIIDSDSKILCKAELISHDDIEEIKNIYYSSHKEYRDMEKQCLNNPTIENELAEKRLWLLWQLNRRVKDISLKLNETQIHDHMEFQNRRVMIVGKVCENNKERFVIIQECVFIGHEEEKKFLQYVNLGK